MFLTRKLMLYTFFHWPSLSTIFLGPFFKHRKSPLVGIILQTHRTKSLIQNSREAFLCLILNKLCMRDAFLRPMFKETNTQESIPLSASIQCLTITHRKEAFPLSLFTITHMRYASHHLLFYIDASACDIFTCHVDF